MGVDACGLAGHLSAFLEALTAQGYAEWTRRRKQTFVAAFVRWVELSEFQIPDLDEACLIAYMGPAPHRSHERAALQQFLEHLRGIGVVPPCPGPEPSLADVLVERYVDHLRHGRGLAERSIAVYSPYVRAFVVAQQLGEGRAIGATLDASVVRRHLLDRALGRSSEYTRLLATALRSFLRFLFLHGEMAVDLSTAVPPVRRWRLAAVPAFLSPAEVERVVAATDRTTASGRRALAMLLLLARLGLRPGEVATLELGDVDWGTGEIIVRGKGGFQDRLPLPEDVGEALALYLQHDRGRSTSRRVFLRRCAPLVGLSGPTAVCDVARAALKRAGLRPQGRVGAHIFRHSLATRMIRQGASLSEISQVLRHRSIDTTQIYAKVDFETLRGVARPWPVQGGQQ